MNTTNSPARLRSISVGSLIFGALGFLFYWWVPLGMVFSLTGLFLGVGDWTMARRRSLDYRLSILGVVIAIAALCLDLIIAYYGWQTWTFGQ